MPQAPKGADPRIVETTTQPTGPAGVLRVILLGLVVALPLASRPLATWSDRLPESWVAVQTLAHEWDDRMQQIGLDRPYDAIHRAMQALTG